MPWALTGNITKKLARIGVKLRLMLKKSNEDWKWLYKVVLQHMRHELWTRQAEGKMETGNVLHRKTLKLSWTSNKTERRIERKTKISFSFFLRQPKS